MGFISTRYLNFRNLKNAELRIAAPEIFLIGENGQGKTNFIESIYVLCFGASFRTTNYWQMVNNKEESSLIKGNLYLDKEVRREVTVKISRKNKKEIKVDSKKIRDRKDLIEKNPCIIFCHQDMEFITGPPERKRRFLNQTLSLIDPLFIDLFRRYGKILKSRNILLKEKKPDLLEIFDRNLAHFGLQIQERRESSIENFNNIFSPLFGGISEMGGDLEIVYRPSWRKGASEQEVISLLKKNRERDFRFENTSSGPHRDLVTFHYNGREFIHLASTGQLRLCSLILKVAQSQFYFSKTKRKPILLLDDVLLELDARKRENFLKVLPEYEQAFFTFLPDENYLKFKRRESIIYTVKEGEFIQT